MHSRLAGIFLLGLLTEGTFGQMTLQSLSRSFKLLRPLLAKVFMLRSFSLYQYNSVKTCAHCILCLPLSKLVVSTSCSLLHTPVDLTYETKLDHEIKSWLAFSAQKLVEVRRLAKALNGVKDEALFSANAPMHLSRWSSRKLTDRGIQLAVGASMCSDHRRATTVSARLNAQARHLELPILPTTTIGSFPQTVDLRKVRHQYKANIISSEQYIHFIREKINEIVRLQEELDIDVLVHGEPERNDMVEYFGEQLSGFACTANGWVQCYGSRCVKPPIIYGEVSRPKAMTVFWSQMAQNMTSRPMKATVTGPVTMLNWSFVRDDQERPETCYQIALAIRKEVEDLEAAGLRIIQIDEPALFDGLPLRMSEQNAYLEWAVRSFRMTHSGVKDITQIHVHVRYNDFDDILLPSIIDMDADVILTEILLFSQRLKLLNAIGEAKYNAGIGLGAYEFYSMEIPSPVVMAGHIEMMSGDIELKNLWVNPPCSFKNCTYDKARHSLATMIVAAKLRRSRSSVRDR